MYESGSGLTTKKIEQVFNSKQHTNHLSLHRLDLGVTYAASSLVPTTLPALRRRRHPSPVYREERVTRHR